MIITLAICDSDIKYLTRLMNFCKRNKSYSIDISIFTNTQSLETFINNQQEKDIIILINEEFNDFIISEKQKIIYVLTEDKDKVNHEMHYLFKYQNVNNIFNSVISSYMSLHIKDKRKFQEGFSTDKKRMLAILDLNNDNKKIKFTWLTSKVLSESKKVLLILFNSYNNPINEENEIHAYNISDMIYYLKESTSISNKIGDFIQKRDNLHYITGITHIFDLLSLNEKDINSLVFDLKNNTNYEEIIFYINIYNKAFYELINLCDLICMPIRDNEYEEGLMSEWERQYNLCNEKRDIKKLFMKNVDFLDSELGTKISSLNPIEKYARDFCQEIKEV